MKIGILGAAGRMGQMLLREVLSRQYPLTLAAAVDHPKSWANGKDTGGIIGADPSGVAVTTDKNAAFEICDLLIDFTTPAAAMDHAALASIHKKKLVVGTTGLTSIEQAALKTAAKDTAVLYSANMSLGVNLLAALIEQTAAKLDAEYDIEIFEAHHRHKVDAPSGTALLLAEAAAKGRGIKLNEALIPARVGDIGARPSGAIGLSVFRGGDIVGEHTVTFAAMGERLELAHKASDRALFAKGAMRAAVWMKEAKPGLYSMRDVLNI